MDGEIAQGADESFALEACSKIWAWSERRPSPAGLQSNRRYHRIQNAEPESRGGGDMSMMIRRGAALILAGALAACGDDDEGFNPTMDDVAGSYTATTFTLTSGSTNLDLLAVGATVTATLDADGTTSGRLVVPDIGSGEIDEDLAGTWTLSGTTVTFTPSTSTLLSDVDFAAGPNILTGEGTYLGAELLLVMTKDE
jgi:hypothetical protein